MFAIAFLGITIVSLSWMQAVGFEVPSSLLRAGWKLFGIALLAMGGLGLLAPATSQIALGYMGMLTAGVRVVFS